MRQSGLFFSLFLDHCFALAPPPSFFRGLVERRLAAIEAKLDEILKKLG